jgi:hypothetical protein
MEALDYWRLCDELNVIQAALLVADCDPSSNEESIELYPEASWLSGCEDRDIKCALS